MPISGQIDSGLVRLAPDARRIPLLRNSPLAGNAGEYSKPVSLGLALVIGWLILLALAHGLTAPELPPAGRSIDVIRVLPERARPRIPVELPPSPQATGQGGGKSDRPINVTPTTSSLFAWRTGLASGDGASTGSAASSDGAGSGIYDPYAGASIDQGRAPQAQWEDLIKGFVHSHFPGFAGTVRCTLHLDDKDIVLSAQCNSSAQQDLSAMLSQHLRGKASILDVNRENPLQITVQISR